MSLKKTLSVLLFACITWTAQVGWAWSHDFWIEPEAFSLSDVRQTTRLHLKLGEAGRGNEFPRDAALIDRFEIHSPQGVSPVPSLSGRLARLARRTSGAGLTAGYLAPASQGLHTVVYQSRDSQVRMDLPHFRSHLRTEGQNRALSLLDASEMEGFIEESFRRCSKSLVQVGPILAGDADRELGLALELVAEANPYALRPGQDLPLRLLYRGKPLIGALVTAVSLQEGAERRLHGLTNDQGRARLKLEGSGEWIIKAVHTLPALPDQTRRWQSFWATLTFALPTS